MASPFSKDFDTLLFNIKTDYENLDDAPDFSRGSTAYIMGSVLASMLWGLYRYQDYIQNQHFPDTADTDNLNHWGSIYDVTRDVDDTDITYLNKVLQKLRQPNAGGNTQDIEDWALDSDFSFTTDSGTTYYNAYAAVVDVADGPGTVGIYTIPNDETIIDDAVPPNNEENLRVTTEAYIELKRALGALSYAVVSAKPQAQAIEVDLIAASGVTLDLDAIKAAILAEVNGMAPGETLYASTIACICKNFGAISASVTTPASEVNAIGNALFFRTTTGTITLNEV